jgi:signal transduction histidine kinase
VMLNSILRPLAESRTYRALAFIASALVLAGLWFPLLVVGWSLTLAFVITPLVVPALLAMWFVTRAGAAAETWVARWLLDAEVKPPVWGGDAKGFWARGWAVLTGATFWKAQAYGFLRMTFGWGIAVGLLSALAASLSLVVAPAWVWSIPHGIDIGVWRINTFAESFVLIPVGLLATLICVHLIGPLASGWRSLSTTLLGEAPPRKLDTTLVVRRRAVRIHALVYAGVNLVPIIVWALTSRGYFWPIWPMLGLGLPLGIHAWVTWVLERPDIWVKRRLNAAFGIHAGVWLALSLFQTIVWAITSRGYFWPVWQMLAAAIALGAHAAVLLMRGDREALTERISTLETSRAGAVDVQEAELRRIERDLHDGAQARLVALGMSLGMAEQKLADDPDAARALLAEARSGAGDALRELRDLARGIHPPVLADRGLDAAIHALAAASPITVSVSVDTPERPKAPVESAAYFVVAESLANAGKHARATHVDVRITRVGEVLNVTVTDNGVGGADAAGGGLNGLARRVDALDGSLTVVSPPGGPTTIRAEMPCG